MRCWVQSTAVGKNHRLLNENFLSFLQDDNWGKWIPYYTLQYNPSCGY